jgi:hypothetical protein
VSCNVWRPFNKIAKTNFKSKLSVIFIAVGVNAKARLYRHPLKFCTHFNRHLAEEMNFADTERNRHIPAVIAIVGFPVGGNDGSSTHLLAVLPIQKIKQAQPAKVLIVAGLESKANWLGRTPPLPCRSLYLLHHLLGQGHHNISFPLARVGGI